MRTHSNLLAFDKGTKPIWQVKLASEIEWQGIVAGEKHVIAVGRSKTGGLRIRFYTYNDGKEAKLQNDDTANDNFAVKEYAFNLKVSIIIVCLVACFLLIRWFA